MGFLNFFQKQSLNDSQLGLFEGDAAAIINTTEPNRKLANQRLMDEAKRRGGKPSIYGRLNRIAVQEMLGEEPDQLYDALGIPPSDRSRLPQQAKEALMVGDIAALEQILDDNAIGHIPLLTSAAKGYRNAKGIFRWNR